jgi:hypothetical protein|tara:strand:+ start:194 stop:460 length:267 start_codon:yes stop_codon:yes gene_type:complete
MKLFVYKTLIVIFFLYILFELTIGMRIDSINNQLNSFKDRNKRIEIKEKILSEMDKANQKESYFTDNERKVISNFVNKLLNELKINTN